jgi:hypothetical protein
LHRLARQRTNKKGDLELFTETYGPDKVNIIEILNSAETEKKFKSSGGFGGVYKNKELWRNLRCY